MIDPHQNNGVRCYTKINLCLGLLAITLLGVLGVSYAVLESQIAFAEGQVATFSAIKASAVKSTNPKDISGQLEYIINYYPSGTKQSAGTRLDRIVENARSNAIADVLDRLRATTGRDLGDDPREWLKKYPP
jgi:hypothetical protein